jgi:hypothetical protein
LSFSPQKPNSFEKASRGQQSQQQQQRICCGVFGSAAGGALGRVIHPRSYPVYSNNPQKSIDSWALGHIASIVPHPQFTYFPHISLFPYFFLFLFLLFIKKKIDFYFIFKRKKIFFLFLP